MGYVKEKKSLYIETTIPSYATAWDSRNPITFGRQEQTRHFWKHESQRYILYVSDYVVDECSDGNPDAAERRLAFIEGIQILPKTDEIEALASFYQDLLAIPDDAKIDCAHLAICTTNRIDFLLSWNFAHLGTESYVKAKIYNDAHDLWTPVMVTPETIYGFMREAL
jgi:hypothetical protein